MTDLAHDAAGPASSESANIVPQQTSQPASSNKGKLCVFISYSRDDLDFADQLAAALDFGGFKCVIDREGISGGEDWKRRLGNLISEADTVVFILSPSSARSDICNCEVEEAARLNKRILPIICRPLEGVRPPARLQDLNYIFFYKEPKAPASGFGTGFAKLATVLNTDFDWVREHTRYLQRAQEWDTRGRPANRLLSGDDIAEAKAWVARRPKSAPEPTALQLDFISASEGEANTRLSQQRKQLEEVAAAQAAREIALHEAEEALNKAAIAHRKRKRQAFFTGGMSFILILVIGLTWYLWMQAKVAEQLREAERHRGVSLGVALEKERALKTEQEPELGAVRGLNYMARRAMFANEFSRALIVADHAHALFPRTLSIETNRAHALMFAGRRDEAKALYLAYKGKAVDGADNKLWEQVIAKDFAELRNAGLKHPMMADIEREFGISP